jgi:hypothetical protein
MHETRAKISVLFFIIVAASCRGDGKTSSIDTTPAGEPQAAAGAVVPVNTGWDENEAGPAMLLSSPDNSEIASVVLPSLTDSALARASGLNADSLMGMSFELFARGGNIETGRMTGRAQSTALDCISWPTVTLQVGDQKAWHVGFRRGMVTALPLDSLEGLASTDSTAITTELARLASALPASNDPAFQGLPFVVRKAYRWSSDRSAVIVGDVVRKINEEANPREEHLLLIAERSASDPSRYETVFESRAAGSEDLVRTSDVLAAIRFVNGGHAAVVVSFEYENGSRVVLIERVAPYRWQQTWRSAYAGC